MKILKNEVEFISGKKKVFPIFQNTANFFYVNLISKNQKIREHFFLIIIMLTSVQGSTLLRQLTLQESMLPNYDDK